MIFSKKATGPFIDKDGNHGELYPNGSYVLTIEESCKVIQERFGKSWEKYDLEFGDRDKIFWKKLEEYKK